MMTEMKRTRSLAAELQRLGDDTRGNVAILTAGFATVAIGCLALAIDLGSLYYEKRRAQAAVDLAAMAAAQVLDAARQRAADTLAQNRYDAPAALSVEIGTYEPNPALPWRSALPRAYSRPTPRA